jgi:beta-glucanase (GH16 family)
VTSASFPSVLEQSGSLVAEPVARLFVPGFSAAGGPERLSMARAVFSDEFGGAQVDRSKWHTELSWGRTNQPEAQYYSDDAVEVRDGVLRLRAERRSREGQPYTSGVVSSHGKFTFTYGYAEARVRVPAGQGLWPAFWLVSEVPKSAQEIDVLEILGQETERVYTSLHWGMWDGSPGSHDFEGGAYQGPDFAKDFHLFAVDWSPSAVVWYVDGVERFRMTEHVPNEPMYVIANLAVGGQWPGYPDSSTPFPATCEFDYIRVYAR